MVSLVGFQGDFFSALKNLVELEYDTVEAYKVAIDQLKTPKFKDKLSEFKADHQRHIDELTRYLQKNNKDYPTGPDNTKQWLVKGKVALGEIVNNDKGILFAMSSNEVDTNTVYERMVAHDNIPNDIKQMMHDFLLDEKWHKAWIEEKLDSFDEDDDDIEDDFDEELDELEDEDI